MQKTIIQLWFLRQQAKRVSVQLQSLRSMKESNQLIPIVKTLRKRVIPVGLLLLLKQPPYAESSGSSRDVLQFTVKRKFFVFVVMYFLDHSTRKGLCAGFTEGRLIVFLIEAVLLIALFCSLSSLKIISPVALDILRSFLNRSIPGDANEFKPTRSQQGFLFEQCFSKINIYSHLFPSQHSRLLSTLNF